ncbi:MAG: hypothetical protein COA78_34950 [Blastopirellula sp.]|nr:MAG: hypothetical protein COA78_34950 [Blastopirellula sp.]
MTKDGVKKTLTEKCKWHNVIGVLALYLDPLREVMMPEIDESSASFSSIQNAKQINSEGSEVRFRLEDLPIYAWETKYHNSSLPIEYHSHSFISGNYFFTFPSELLEAIVEKIGEERFDGDLLKMERELSRLCNKSSSHVGYWQEGIITCSEINPQSELSFTDDEIQSCNLNPLAVRHALRKYKDRDSKFLENSSRAYSGWLLTNPQFLSEHDTLLSSHHEAIQRWGTSLNLSRIPEMIRTQILPDPKSSEDPLWSEYVDQCKEFCTRWRLDDLVAPYLPVPSKPKMAGQIPETILENLFQSGGLFYLPDTIPLPSRDQLRSLLDDALHREDTSEHLAEWQNIIRSDNFAKNQMNPFIRKLELQHYWKLLHQRHSSAINRRIGKLHEIFAERLETTPKQIKNDLTSIKKQLGADWEKRDWS